jgi:membrane dipeptidase
MADDRDTARDAREIYAASLVWDDHCGFSPGPDDALDPLLSPWRDAGVGYLSINVYFDPQPWTIAQQTLTSLRARLPSEAPYCRVVSSPEEIDEARADGKLAITFDIEGMNALDGCVEMVERYYELGVRHMLFAYNRNNLAGSGCHDEDSGLTDFGRRVIDEMNRVGMVVDCSHTGFATTMAAMERSSQPVIFSHSNPRALADHGRNITDEQIRACAATGGVVGVNGVNLFLGEEDATPATVARHAAYVAELTGPEHVGISLDYASVQEAAVGTLVKDASYYWPAGSGYDRPTACLDVRRLPEVADALADAGFDAEGIGAVLGGNFRRVAEQVWR